MPRPRVDVRSVALSSATGACGSRNAGVREQLLPCSASLRTERTNSRQNAIHSAPTSGTARMHPGDLQSDACGFSGAAWTRYITAASLDTCFAIPQRGFRAGVCSRALWRSCVFGPSLSARHRNTYALWRVYWDEKACGANGKFPDIPLVARSSGNFMEPVRRSQEE